MSKSVLISCLLVSMALSSSIRAPEPTADSNYDDLQAFLTGFMTGYTGSAYDMSQCLTPETQSNLDQILGSTYGYIFTGKFAELKVTYETFLKSLVGACGECGLTSVASSLNSGLSAKGKVWYEVNIVYNSLKVEQALKTTITQMESKKWTNAGETLGQITNVLIPYIPASPPVTLEGSLLDFNTAAYQTWWKGLVAALAVSPKRQGPCSLYLLNFANTTIPVFTDFSKINSKDFSGLSTLFGDTASSLSYVQSTYTTDFCDFALLGSNVKELFSKAGAIELASRYASKASLINSSWVNIQNCDLNAYACGQGYGNIIKYMINWSIN